MNFSIHGHWKSLLVLFGAAVLEVAGDAIIRRGLRAGTIATIAAGFVVIGSYGVAVNLLNLDFSRLLGAYVGAFALVSLLTGWLVFGDRINALTWMGLGLVLAGSAVIYVASA